MTTLSSGTILPVWVESNSPGVSALSAPLRLPEVAAERPRS